MRFDDLEALMRPWEDATTRKLLPGMYTILRLDGHGFSGLTRRMGFEKPFDTSFRDLMAAVVSYLVAESKLKIIYAYFQSDEISLLLDLADRPYDLKDRKLISLLAGMASAVFTVELNKLVPGKNEIAVFDNRYIQYPNSGLVVDYFRWRNEDAARNALNGYCYWKLRQDGHMSVGQATQLLAGKGQAFKNDLLMNRFQLNFNDQPTWQKRGVGVTWESYIKQGFNPVLGENVTTDRRRLKFNYELPMGQAYSDYITDLLRTYHEPELASK